MQDNFKDIIKTKYFPTLPYLNQERSQKFFGIVLTLFALSFFGFFAINPTISTILKLQKELSDNEFILSQLDSKIKNISKLREEYVSLQNNLPTVTDAIAMQPDVHLLFAQIQSIARESNVAIKKIQNFEVEVLKNDKRKEKKYYAYSFSIAGNGSFENISNFISAITNMQRIVDIDVFVINNITGQNSQPLGFSIQGTAFFKQ